MITEDYVSFETAKLLKEKGFDWNTYAYYEDEDNPNISLRASKDINWNETEFISKPTLQVAMKWLREKHNLIPIILTGEYSQKPLYYWFRIDTIIEGRLEYAIYREDEKEFDSYEQVCEAAINYCLENLI